MTLGCFGEFQRAAKRIFIDIDIACSSMSSVGESLLSIPSTSHSPLQFPSSFFFYPHNCKHIVRQLKLKRYFRKICVIEGGTDLMILEVRNYPAPGGKEERSRKRSKMFREGKYLFSGVENGNILRGKGRIIFWRKNLVIGGEKEEKEKEGNIWSAEEKRNIWRKGGKFICGKRYDGNKGDL